MKILIIGASGQTGQKLLEYLALTTHEVAGLVRNQEQTSIVEAFRAKPLPGDLEGSVQDMAAGFDAVIFVAGSAGKNVKGVDYEGLAKMVDSAVKHEVKRFLHVSSINIGKEPSQFIQEMKNYYQNNNEIISPELLAAAQNPNYLKYLEMKTLAEKKLTEARINYTILRAGFLTQEEPTGTVNITPGKLDAFGKISRANLALCFIEALENEATYRNIYTVIDGSKPIKGAFTPLLS